MNICQNMNMIFNAIDSVEMDFLVSNNTGYIGIKLFSLSGTNGFFTVLCSYYTMIQQLTVT